MHIITSADAIARASYNALLYCPKTPPWDMCLLIITPGRVSYLTSDSYSLSWATHEATTPDLHADEVTFKLSRDDLVELEKRAREGKKERVVIDFDMASQQIWYQGEDHTKDLRMTDMFIDGIAWDSWDEINLATFREIISTRELDPLARRVLLAPEYLRKLGQLKRDKNQSADLWFGAEESDTVLIKVGDGFRLAIEPIDHERHRKALGEEATW